MSGFVARGTILNRDADAVWIAEGGSLAGGPIDDATVLPGSFVLAGLVDAHAHPAMTRGDSGPQPRTLEGTIGELESLAARGVAFLRDTGSPEGVTLMVPAAGGRPRVQAAGRFLAPPGRYFPGVYEPTPAAELVEAVRGEVARGARWVKIVGDFLTDMQPPITPTYDIATIAAACDAAHALGARVAVHVTLDNVGEIVDAGVDSVEHGLRLDPDTLERMRARNVAWVPTIGAFINAAETAVDDEKRRELTELRERVFEMLRLADRIGVPILTGSDVVGSVPGEVAGLVRAGLAPDRALAAATTSGYGLLGVDPWQAGARANLVTYDADPREHPEALNAPVAVVVEGVRLR